MNEEITDNANEQNDRVFNSSEPEGNADIKLSQGNGNVALNYGDIIIMIWRRIKLNEKMTERLKY